MTLVPEDKKNSLSIWLRQPARKIRMANCTDDELTTVQRIVGEASGRIYGWTKAGNYVVIPASNIAYIEAVEL